MGVNLYNIPGRTVFLITAKYLWELYSEELPPLFPAKHIFWPNQKSTILSLSSISQYRVNSCNSL